MAAKFTMTKSVVIRGGWLKDPWVLEADAESPADSTVFFYKISDRDRNLAKAIGGEMESRDQVIQAGALIEELTSLVDDAVDDAIRESRIASDPMADQNAKVQIPTRGREKAFEKANVPEILTVQYPALMDENGQTIKPQSIRVKAQSRRGRAPMVVLDEDFLEWFLKAASAKWFEPKTKKRKSMKENPDSLPKLHQPNVQWAYSGPIDAWVLKTRYRKQTGKYGYKQENCKDPGDMHLWKMIVEQAENRLQDYFNKHNVEGAASSGDAPSGAHEPEVSPRDDDDDDDVPDSSPRDAPDIVE